MTFSPRALRTVRRLTAPSVFNPNGLLASANSGNYSLRLLFVFGEGDRNASLKARLTLLFREAVKQAGLSPSSTWELTSCRRGGGRPAFFSHPSLSPLVGLAANAGASWTLTVTNDNPQTRIESFLKATQVLGDVISSSEIQSISAQRSVRLIIVLSDSTPVWVERPGQNSSNGFGSRQYRPFGRLQLAAENSTIALIAPFANLAAGPFGSIDFGLQSPLWGLLWTLDLFTKSLEKVK